MNSVPRAVLAYGGVALALAVAALVLVISYPRAIDTRPGADQPSSVPTSVAVDRPSLAPSIDAGVATPAIESPSPSTPGASLPPPTVEPSLSIEAHDRFWHPFVDFGPLFGLPFGLKTLEDATDLADIVIRGSITDLYIGEQWIGAKDEPGEPLAYVAIEIHDVLKGEPESRTEGLVEVQFGFGFRGSDFEAIASEPMPEGDYLWFLIDESEFRETKGQPPRDSEIAPFAYFIPNEVQGVAIDANGFAEVVLADRFERSWGTDLFPMTVRGHSFEEVVNQIRNLVEAATKPLF